MLCFSEHTVTHILSISACRCCILQLCFHALSCSCVHAQSAQNWFSLPTNESLDAQGWFSMIGRKSLGHWSFHGQTSCFFFLSQWPLWPLAFIWENAPFTEAFHLISACWSSEHGRNCENQPPVSSLAMVPTGVQESYALATSSNDTSELQKGYGGFHSHGGTPKMVGL